MGADGSNVRRISFGSGRYTTPVWSPDGKLIAFTKQEGAVFHIGVMKPDGSAERILTDSYLDEGPTWAPNGRVLMFTREIQGGRGAQIWSMAVVTLEIAVFSPVTLEDPAPPRICPAATRPPTSWAAPACAVARPAARPPSRT